MAGSIGTSGGSRPPYEGYWSPYRFGGGDVTTDEGCRCSKKTHIRCQEWAELRQLPEKEWMTGWRDDGRMRGAIFQFFFQKFLLLDSCRLKELLNKGRHFWWSHLSQGGGSLFCILSLFYIYLGNLEVSNWVSDWVYLWLLCDFACSTCQLVSFYHSDVLRIKSWGDAWSPSGTTRPKKVRCSEESAERAGPENQKSKRHASLPWSKDMKGKQSIQIWPNSDIRCTRVPCPAMPIPGRQPRMWNWQSRLYAFFFFSFFELSFTVKVLVPNVGLSQASTDSFHVVSNSGIYQRHPDARSLAVWNLKKKTAADSSASQLHCHWASIP